MESELVELSDEALGFEVSSSTVEVVSSEIMVFDAVLEHVVDGGEH